MYNPVETTPVAKSEKKKISINVTYLAVAFLGLAMFFISHAKVAPPSAKAPTAKQSVDTVHQVKTRSSIHMVATKRHKASQ